MEWLISAIVANIVSISVLAGVYLYLRVTDRKPYLGLWAASWGLALVRFGFRLAIELDGQTTILLICNQLAALLSGYTLLRGSSALLGRKLSKGWSITILPLCLYIIAASVLGFHWFLLSLPTYIFLAVVYVFTGGIFLRNRHDTRLSNLTLGIAFTAWGLLKVGFIYIDINPVFDTVIYMLEAFFGLAVAIFTLIAYFQKGRSDLVASEQRYHDANLQLLEAQDTLQKDRDFEDNLINTASAVIIVLDMQGCITLSNQYLVELTGYAPDEIEGEDWFNTFVPEQDRDWMRHNMFSDPSSNKVRSNVFPISTRSGRLVEIEWLYRMLRDPRGNPVGLLATGMDITERLKNEEMNRRQLEMMGSLREIDISITSGQDLNITLRMVVEQACRHLQIDAADILLLDAEGTALNYVVGRGFHSHRPDLTRQVRGNGLAWQVVKTCQKIEFQLGLDDHEETAVDLMRLEGFQSYLGMPLIGKGRVKGVIELFHRGRMENDIHSLDFLVTLSGQAAVAMENTALIARMNDANREMVFSYDNTIEGWARALEMRDPGTEGHSQRVVDNTLVMAVRMGIRGEELVHVRRGALLHDIGKMAIPDSILLKSGALTDEEWEIMRKHPQYAYNLLEPIEFLRPALDIPFCHHEKWDGSGYPRGLKGRDIPLAARIFAVADVWDALLSDRPYRKKWSEDQAVDNLNQQNGIHFDPQVVEVFLKFIGARKYQQDGAGTTLQKDNGKSS